MSACDILTENLPDYFKPILEFQQIIKAQGYGLDKLNEAIIKVRNNNYIQTADADTLSYYEKLLKITSDTKDHLEYRRKRILSIIARDSPFSIGFLNQQLTRLYGKDGYEVEIDYQKCELNIIIKTDIYGAVELFYDFIWDVIPIHIFMKVNHIITTQIDGQLHYGGSVEVIETINMK